jgi:hypothetical protein
VRGTYANNPPGFDIRVLSFDRAHDAWDLLRRLGWRTATLEERAEVLALLWCVRRVPRDVGRVAFKPVRNEDFVLVMFIGAGENVGALKRLGEVAKDVVDEEKGLCGMCGASDI